MLEAITPPDTSEGGRFSPSQDFNDKSFIDQMRELQSIAHRRGLDKALALIAEPWLRTPKSSWKTQTAIVKAAIATDVSTGVDNDDYFTSHPEATASTAPPVVVISDEVPEPPTPHEQPRTIRTLQDMVTPLPSDHEPWQYQKYSKDNSVWQGAAQRRRHIPDAQIRR